MTKRNSFIDFLRGIAILAMILIHTTVFFYSDIIAATLWNWGQLAVPIFLFCASYLFIKKDMQQEIRLLPYFKKRIVRLLIPYYIFLLFFIPLVFILTPEKVSLRYIFESIILIGGVDINWLVLLFLMLAILFPFFQWAQKKGIFFWGFFSLSLASTILFLFWIPPASYKLFLWMPWSLIFFFAYWFHAHEKQKKQLVAAMMILFGIAFLTYISNLLLGHSTLFRDNKYPPNLFYLSFGMLGILLLSFFAEPLTKNSLVRKSIHFFSIFSYDIYFIHYGILTIFVAFLPQLHWPWWILLLTVLILSVLMQLVLNFLRRYAKKDKRAR